MMTVNDKKSQKMERAILTFDCEEYNSLGSAILKAKSFSNSQIIGAKEIWAVKKVIFWSEESQKLEEREIDKVILFFYGDKYPNVEDLLSDPSLIEFLKCTKSKIFITEKKIPWPESDNKEK